MKKSTIKKSTFLVGVAVCAAAGAVALTNTRKARAKRLARRAGRRIELVGEMLQSVADITK